MKYYHFFIAFGVAVLANIVGAYLYDKLKKKQSKTDLT